MTRLRNLVTAAATWWLRRQGLSVTRPIIGPELIVSGHALAVAQDDDGIEWLVSFPCRPHVTALNYSMITRRPRPGDYDLATGAALSVRPSEDTR